MAKFYLHPVCCGRQYSLFQMHFVYRYDSGHRSVCKSSPGSHSSNTLKKHHTKQGDDRGMANLYAEGGAGRALLHPASEE